MVLNGVELFDSVPGVVLTEDASHTLVASICFHDHFQSTIPLCKYGGGHELRPQVVKGLLLFIAPSEWYVLGQFDKRVSFATVVGYKAAVVIGKASESLDFLE